MDYFNLALHWLCPTAPHLLRRVAAGMDRGGRFYQSEWPLRQGTRGRWRGLYASKEDELDCVKKVIGFDGLMITLIKSPIIVSLYCTYNFVKSIGNGVIMSMIFCIR